MGPTFLLKKPLAVLLTSLALLTSLPTRAATTYGEQLEGFQYPYPLHHFDFLSQQQSLSMGYMDVKPVARANGKTVVLMHGKNFCGATWEETIRALSQQGYRVIAPDQIGFCSATKPARYQYSFQQLADNTHQLLARLGVEKAVIVGHSTGGNSGSAQRALRSMSSRPTTRAAGNLNMTNGSICWPDSTAGRGMRRWRGTPP